MNHLKTILSILTVVLISSASHAKLVINELMQSNIDCIMDDLNDFPDSWVELYNNGTTTEKLKNYKLNITNDRNNAWTLPDIEVAAGGHVVVYCDKVGKGLHTNFRISSDDDCELWLYNEAGLSDVVKVHKKQPAPNISYGRATDGTSKWGYQATPTPGTANCGEVCDRLLGEPIFSQEGCVMDPTSSVRITLSLPEGTPEDAEIRYTIDGKEPTTSSHKYVSPILFTTNRVIRAKIFCKGYLSPRSTAHSYIFFPRTRALTLPVISIITDNKYMTDSKIGIYVDGSYQSSKKNYQFNWRRPINIEMFEGKDQPSVINQLCETRVMGGATRNMALKSLAVYANKRFGKKRFNYEFFPDLRPGYKKFKSFALRNAGNDFPYLFLRDAICQVNMATHVDLDWQGWRPAIIYINGTYKGILNIRDRSNEDNVYTYYDGLEDVDVIENWNQLKEGTWDHFNAFKAFYAKNGHTLKEYAELMDLDEFMNLMIMNLYYDNKDFPGNNCIMWRPRAEGGKWRWIAKDVDFGFGMYSSPYTYKTIHWINNPAYDNSNTWGNNISATQLFKQLMNISEFRDAFVNKASVYIGDFLNERGTCAVWDRLYDVIKTEYPVHRSLYGSSWPDYNGEVTYGRTWLKYRANEFYNQLADYYRLGSPVSVTINDKLSSEELEGADITLNGIRLSQGIFNGKLFLTSGLRLVGKAPEGKIITGWKITQTQTDGSTTTQERSGSSLDLMLTICKNISIQAQVGIPEGILAQTMEEDHWSCTADGGMIHVHNIQSGTPVSVFTANGKLLYHGIASESNISIPISWRGVCMVKAGSLTAKVMLR